MKKVVAYSLEITEPLIWFASCQVDAKSHTSGQELYIADFNERFYLETHGVIYNLSFTVLLRSRQSLHKR